MPADWQSRLDAEFRAAIAGGVFSGASLLVSRGRMPDFERTWGTVESAGAPVTPAVRFDLASLTKPLVTAPLCMAAVEGGFLNLDDPLPKFFPGLVPGDKKEITIRSLLSHSSGLPAYKPFYPELIELPPGARRNALASMVLKTPLDNPPGKAAIYSDLGFMLLGLVLERQLGARLDRLACDLLFAPLGIDELHFCPIDTPPPSSVTPAAILQAGNLAGAPGARYAATQFCPWRKRLLSGEVDDENAWALNGVSGHAGLFGTARGVFGLLSFLWNIYELDAAGASPSGCCPAPHPAPGAGSNNPGAFRGRLCSPEIVRLFWTRTGGAGNWCLGYDTPSRKGYSSAGRYFSQSAIGHLGFTGVSFWLDLEKRVLIVLLTNRVHPARQNDGIRQFRPVLHDIVMEAFTHGN